MLASRYPRIVKTANSKPEDNKGSVFPYLEQNLITIINKPVWLMARLLTNDNWIRLYFLIWINIYQYYNSQQTCLRRCRVDVNLHDCYRFYLDRFEDQCRRCSAPYCSDPEIWHDIVELRLFWHILSK